MAKRKPLEDIETKDLKQHYVINAGSFYGNQQYADLALILKKNNRINS